MRFSQYTSHLNYTNLFSIGKSARESVIQWVSHDQSVSQSWPVSQSVSQTVRQSVRQPVSQLVSQSVGQLVNN